MSDSIVLITGANRGLGFFTAQILAKTGRYHVFVGARSLGKAEEAITELTKDGSVSPSALSPIEIDVASDKSIDAAVASVQSKFGHLDILVNNAGVALADLPSDGKDTKTLREKYHAEFDTNTIGCVLVLQGFLPLLQASKSPEKRIVFTSTSLSSLNLAADEKNPWYANNFPMYRASKAALNMLAVYYANTLFKEHGIAVVLCCPGFCATNLNNFAGFDDPRVGAQAIVKAVSEGSNEQVNQSFIDRAGTIPW